MHGKWRAYFELLRFPAVFTAIADVTMGYLVAHGDLQPTTVYALILVTSASLYLAGMVFNDAFDAELDAVERPERPIPSGRVSRAAAVRLGWLLFVVGVSAAGAIELLTGDRGPLILAVALATFIYLYDWAVKRYSIAPLNMGLCRTLNVLLGMGIVGIVDGEMTMPWSPTELFIAAGIGVYVGGITIFARSEARMGNRWHLAGGITVMLLGLLLLMMSGRVELRPAHRFTEQDSWPLLWFALAAVIAGRCLWAVWRLEPRATQVAVRNSLRALIVIDAALVAGFCSPAWGWLILALLAPMLVLERWFSTT